MEKTLKKKCATIFVVSVCESNGVGKTRFEKGVKNETVE